MVIDLNFPIFNLVKSHIKKIFIMRQWRFFILLLLVGCSGLEKSEKEKLREKNAKGEYVYRHHDETLYTIPPPRHREREPYSWEEE
jgi:hypothetical protein